MTFDEWMTNCSHKILKRMMKSWKWYQRRMAPRLALKAGWNGGRAVERIKSRDLRKQNRHLRSRIAALELIIDRHRVSTETAINKK